MWACCACLWCAAHPWLCQTDSVVPNTPMDPTVVLRLRAYSKMSRFRKLAARVRPPRLSLPNPRDAFPERLSLPNP